MITIENLFYNYDSKFSALYDVSLNFDKNTVLISDNLSSSTLFRVISKQDTDYIGKILINNTNLKEIKFKDLSLSYITNPPYFIKKSVSYNIAYPLIIRKENKKDALQTAITLLKEYGMEDKKMKDCTNLEKLLTTFLRTLIRHPKIVLIDDVFTNLKNSEIKSILEIIKKLSNDSLLVIALNDNKMLEHFENYNIIKLINGSVEK